MILKRIIGWEDEFRATAGSTVLTLDELLTKSSREFFAQAKHILLGERKPPPFEESIDLADYDSSRTDCIWTWYGGKIYDEQDSLIEASSPPVPLLAYPIDNLIQAISVGRAQIGELVETASAIGVSSQLNIMLDSYFLGEDLCDENKYVDLNVPTQGLTKGRAHKLGSDLARIMVHTAGPAIGYILFNSSQHKGAIFRPRGNKRLEFALPFVPRVDQMTAGVLFSIAAVEHITKAIKNDLSSLGGDFTRDFKGPDYYQRVLSAFPLRVEDVRMKHNVSFRLGFEVAGGYEEAILTNGSEAKVHTNWGPMPVRKYLGEYISFLKAELNRWGSNDQRGVLDDYARGLRVPEVDTKIQHPHFELCDYLADVLKDSPTNFLNRLSVRPDIYPISSLVKEPSKTIGHRSDSIFVRRNLGDDQDWPRASFELLAEDYGAKKLIDIRLEVDRESLVDYLRLERQSTDARQFLERIVPYKRSEREVSMPDHIFVYGTFLSDAVVQSLHKGKVISRVDAHTRGTLYNLREFPVLIESYYDNSVVHGQLIKLEDLKEFLQASDRYEGADREIPLFIRAFREVVLEDDSKTLAWIYIGNANHPTIRRRLEKANIIPEGRWQPPTLT